MRLHHLGRDVGVVVEADGDRHLVPHHRPHASQQLALAVLEGRADHGAVQVEIDRVDRHGRRQPPDQLAGDALVGVGSHQPAGAAAGPQQRHDLVPGAHVAQEARQREAGVGQPLDHLGAAHQRRPVAVAGEVGEVRPPRHEAVGLVVEAADRDPRHERSPRPIRLWRDARRRTRPASRSAARCR